MDSSLLSENFADFWLYGQPVFELEEKVKQEDFYKEGGKVFVGSSSSFPNYMLLVTEIFTAGLL